MGRVAGCALLITGLLWLTGCAGWPASLDTPDLQVTRLERLPTRGLEQRFRIGLRLVNPGRRPLKLQGLSYTLSLEGYDLLSGTTDNIPTVPPFSETTFSVTAATDLVESMRFFSDVVTRPRQTLDYRITARLHTGRWPWGVIPIVENGEISLKNK